MSIKLKTYKFNKDLTNATISYKIDGVQAISKDGVWMSRADKPLHNLPEMPDGVYEAFIEDWSTSVSAVRTHDGALIDKKNLYRLDVLDDRLLMSAKMDVLTISMIKRELRAVLLVGYEGLCITSDQGHFKVKPVETHDVAVTSMVEGTGKHKGKMGALVTAMGKVGTGFTDKQRQEFWDDSPVGKIIEVESMMLTPKGKFRHPRYIRLRVDK